MAVLGKTRGNRGEITAFALSSKPERYQQLREVCLFDASGQLLRTAEVESAWFHSGTLVFKFRGVDSISEAEALARRRGARAAERAGAARRRRVLRLRPGRLRSRGPPVSGESLGRVTELEDGGGAGLLVVDGGLLIPFARSICVEIDPAAKRIVVELPEGLKDLNRP